ncbi:MAG: YdcF family protein [Saprospiraceae bacterium]|nr:YdcF family protein [Saprospiraceae bacterium]
MVIANKKKCIIVLGSPNDAEGNLSPIALSRLKVAKELYQAERVFILCTGGFGPNFNVTKHPHALYAQHFLLANGVMSEDLLDSVLSANTVEDAVLSLKQLNDLGIEEVLVVTSDYHIPRVKFIFDKLFDNYQVFYHPADSQHLDESARQKLFSHEIRALKGLKEKGLIINGKVFL